VQNVPEQSVRFILLQHVLRAGIAWMSLAGDQGWKQQADDVLSEQQTEFQDFTGGSARSMAAFIASRSSEQ
jgi:hypothetical protein